MTAHDNAPPEPRLIDAKELPMWADDPKGPAFLHWRQRLMPVEGRGGVVFPATYARRENDQRTPYNINRLSDGTLVAQLDSVGSQANRIEPLFKAAKPGEEPNRLAALVPQIEFEVFEPDTNEKRIYNLLDVGHRLGDALVRCTDLGPLAATAFAELILRGDATRIAKLSPMSLVFGVWDSRGTQAKLPRLVSSTIRAWDVSELTRSAQYFPPLDYSKQPNLLTTEQKEKAERNPKSNEAIRGFVAVPATDTHGGIVVHGDILRDITVNLVALRALGGGDDNGRAVRRYALGLALLAATVPQDGFLRQGCFLVPVEKDQNPWMLIERTGNRIPVLLDDATLFDFAQQSAASFGIEQPRSYPFKGALALKDLTEGKKKGKNKRIDDGEDESESAE